MAGMPAAGVPDASGHFSHPGVSATQERLPEIGDNGHGPGAMLRPAEFLMRIESK
jgi:hypothetical protein